MTTSLTTRAIEALKPVPGKRVEAFDDVVTGLALRVTETGTKSWSLFYRTQSGRQRRLTIGRYPTIGLQQARTLARVAAREAALGADPAADKRAQRHGETINALADEYLDRHAKKHKRSWQGDERMLRAEIRPKWGSLKVTEVSRRHVRDLVEAIAERGAPVTANRCLALVRKMLNFAISRDWLEANPAALVAKPGHEVSRDRVLTDDELRRIWRCLERLPATNELPAPGRPRSRGPSDDPICPVNSAQAAILKLRLLTAQRGGEVARMRWVDVDLEDGWWTIPAEHAKNKRRHRVPLCASALAIVSEQLRSTAAGLGTFVFTDGETGAHDRGKKAAGLVAEVLGIEFRGHDLRRTAATRMAAAGVAPSDVAKVLNHSAGGPSGATAVYVRHEFDREKLAALETWERVFAGILGLRSGARLLPMHHAAAKASGQ
jgi:integrase